MDEQRKKQQQTPKRDRNRTPSVDERPDTADNRDYRGPAPQGGRGTPSQAEGERKDTD